MFPQVSWGKRYAVDACGSQLAVGTVNTLKMFDVGMKNICSETGSTTHRHVDVVSNNCILRKPSLLTTKRLYAAFRFRKIGSELGHSVHSVHSSTPARVNLVSQYILLALGIEFGIYNKHGHALLIFTKT